VSTGARSVAEPLAAAPEGVVVLGMHRSGTSLITRLVNLLGLAVCSHDDLLVGRARNPRGHWESKSLLRLNDRLLSELGGSWYAPPQLGPAETSRLLGAHRAEAAAAFAHAHPERPWVWKDPRTCVLAPFWSAVLGQRAAYLLITRHPFEVSDSLARRSGVTPLLGLALWERYTRQAMLGAAGRPLMACTYDAVLADPLAWCERLVAFLGELGVRAGPVDSAAVGAFVMDELRHSRRSWTQLEPGPEISAEQVELARAASVYTVQRSYTPPPLPHETPRTVEIFAEIASRKGRERQLAALPEHLVASTARTPDEVSTARTPSEVSTARTPDDAPTARTPVSIVLAYGAEASLDAIADDLPAGSETLLAGAEAAPAESEAGALALAVGASSCEIVLLCAGILTSCDPWYEQFTQALAVAKVGAVAPLLRSRSDPRARRFGRGFVDVELSARAVTGRPQQELEPAALLPVACSAYDRALLDAAGGVDGGFSSAAAAIAELSLRLWRMGFRCCIAPRVQAWSRAPEDDGEVGAEDASGLYDRMRIAALHFGPDRLRELDERVRTLAAYEQASVRLAASDVPLRRAAIEAVCAFPVDRYFERFPLDAGGADGRQLSIPRVRGSVLERLRRRAGFS
jgi:hypothetical protein